MPKPAHALNRPGFKRSFAVRPDRLADLDIAYDNWDFKQRKLRMIAETRIKKAPFVIEWQGGFKIGISQADQERRHLVKLVG